MSDFFFPPFESCPICDSKDISFFIEIYYWRENPLQFYRCQSCKAHFANPMPNNRLITEGNDALVRWYDQGRNFAQEFRDARHAYLKGRLLADQLSSWKKEGKLLDLGCCNGFLPMAVQDHSQWKAEGIEISHQMSEFINSKIGIRCHQGTLEELQLPENQYDFIICHDLIEHINQPQQFLKEVVRVLKPGGRIQIITPNPLQDLGFAKRAYQKGMPVTMLLNHIMYFSPTALRFALEKAGLRVRKLYCYDVRYALKDFGVFGMGQPKNISLGPSMNEALSLPLKDNLSQWNSENIHKLRTHKKVSRSYGFFKEVLPKWFTLRMPEKFGIGHEVYALAEKV